MVLPSCCPRHCPNFGSPKAVGQTIILPSIQHAREQSASVSFCQNAPIAMVHRYSHVLALALISALVVSASEYEVEFSTRESLGMQLDSGLKVVGFRRPHGSQKLPAEASGWIRVGDHLAGVNGDSVAGKPLAVVAQHLHNARLPKMLRFTSFDGGDRYKEMRQLFEKEEKMSAQGLFGHLRLARDGVPFGSLPFVRAEFGQRPSCKPLKIITASPSNACGAFSNERSMRGRYVLVDRGMCTFLDKASNVQAAGGVGMILLNDAGKAEVMPNDPEDDRSSQVVIPSIMIGESDAGTIHRALAHTRRDLSVQMVLDGEDCAIGTGKANKTMTEKEIKEKKRVEELGAAVAGRIYVAEASRGMAEAEVGSKGEMHISDMQQVAGRPVKAKFDFVRALFSAPLPAAPHGIVVGDPRTGCSAPTHTTVRGRWVLVDRGECPFEEKAAILKAAGAVGVIVINTEPGVIEMPARRDGLQILPAIMLSKHAGAALRKFILRNVDMTLLTPIAPSPSPSPAADSADTPTIAAVPVSAQDAPLAIQRDDAVLAHWQELMNLVTPEVRHKLLHHHDRTLHS